jgi:SAM-dependent methyltransferase
MSATSSSAATVDSVADGFFERMRGRLEDAYLASDDPRRQSGFSGNEERWVALRRPVADAIDRSGTFLDIGCANGYLAESVVRWCAERGISVEPHGVDLSPRLVELARSRLTQWRDRFEVGNALEWMPPRMFDFVRTELLYVPGDDQARYVRHLLENVVAPGGALLVANYLEGSEDVRGRYVEGADPTIAIVPHLLALGYSPERHCDGFDPVKGRRVRVAVVRRVVRGS